MKDAYDFSTAKRGAVAPAKGKTRITIMLDDAVLEAARQRADEAGMGYQTLINSLLKEALCPTDGGPQNTVLNQIFIALENLAKGQEALEAKLGDTPLPMRYPTHQSTPLQVREEQATMKTGAKGPSK
jgi:hypothetical protein